MKKILFILLLSMTVYAEKNQIPVAYEYLVFASSLAKAGIDPYAFAVGEKGNVGGHWEFSSVVYSGLDCGFSTNYYLIWITTSSTVHNMFLENTTVKKYYYRTRRRSVWGDAQGRHDVFETLKCYPNDFYKVYPSTW